MIRLAWLFDLTVMMRNIFKRRTSNQLIFPFGTRTRLQVRLQDSSTGGGQTNQNIEPSESESRMSERDIAISLPLGLSGSRHHTGACSR
jgi:hypothetical protein